MRKLSYLFLLSFFTVLLYGCAYSRTEQAYCFGTVCTVTVFQHTTDDVFETLWQEMNSLEKKISAKREDSEVSEINRRAGSLIWTEVSKETYSLVSLMLEIHEKSGGALNPAIGSITELWGIATENAHIPSDDEIESALECTDAGQIELRQSDGHYHILLKKKGMKLDLGASGKGLAGDIAASVLRKNGIKSALINFGGNVVLVGKMKNGLLSRPFRIGIQNPDGDRGEYSHYITVSDASVVTSGSYERYLEVDGTRYSHIMDPSSGRPISSDSLCVTVTGPRGDYCDCLSTVCFVLGYEKSLAMMKDFSQYSAVFLLKSDDGTKIRTVGNRIDLQ